MTRLMRPISSILLILALVASSVSMGVMRAEARGMAGGTTFVICTGYGVATVTLDADGNPTRAPHPCPDCVTGLTVFLSPVATSLPPRFLRASMAVLPPLPMLPEAATNLPFQARGPPRLI